MPLNRMVLTAAIVGVTCAGLTGCQSSSPAPSSDIDAGQVGTGGQAGQSELGGQAGQAPSVGGQSGQAGGDDIATIMASYTSWAPLSDKPVDISAQISSMCRAPTKAEQGFVASVHTRFALRDWANPQAAAAISAKGSGGFAGGATIVKEKFATDATSGEMVLSALGIMIKRPAGFYPSGGDWEFVYWNATDGVSRGPTQLGTCTTCHAGGGAIDFVFLDASWRTVSAQ